MDSTVGDKNLNNKNNEIKDEFDNGTDNKICVSETVIYVGSIKEEPCNMENEQSSSHDYMSIKDETIDDLTVVAQETELVTDCTDDKESVIVRGYIKQDTCATESESGSFHEDVNVKDEVIEEPTVVIVQETGLTSNIKENDLIYCEGCGEEYDLYCLKCPMLIRIFNSNNPMHNKINRTLPKGIIDICKTPNGVGIVALKPIPQGVVFGPFEGLYSIKDEGVSKWRLKNEELVYTKGPKWLNWMQYIKSAGQNTLRNLTPFQYQDALYYRSDHHISAGSELLVYCDSGRKENEIPGVGDSYWKPPVCERIDDTYACTFCCVGYKSKYHLEVHNSRCPEKRNRGDFCKENIQCAFCKIYLDEKEHLDYHMDQCCKSNREKYAAALCFPEDIDKPKRKNEYKCLLCEYNTSRKDRLKQHQLSHSDLRMYKCPECPHWARTDNNLQKHLLTHAKSRRSRFKCELCGERFTRSDFFVAHQKRKHFVSVYKCDKCAFETTNGYNLRIHLATHNDAKRYGCKTCGKQFQTELTLYEHVKNVHNEKKKKYTCPKCEFESFYWASLKQHLLNMHSGVKRFKCPRCDFKTSYKKNMERHVRYHVDREVLQSFQYERHEGLKPFGCTLCPYKAKTKTHLKQHLVSHDDDRPFKCDVCPLTFKKKSALNKHTGNIHSEAKKEVYKCSKCEYSTRLKSDFKRHVANVHDGLELFTCTFCPYKVLKRSTLKGHMARHTDDKAFKCDLCPKMYNQKESLRTHVQNIHSGTKYKCLQCSFETKYKKNLKCHVNTHNKSELFQCSKCEFNSYNKRSFGAHLARHERR